MVVTVDVGNSKVKIVEFLNGNVDNVHSYDLGKDKWRNVLEKMAEKQIIISSTSLDERTIIRECGLRYAYLINKYTQYPIRFTYNRLWTLGKDRIAGSVGAYTLGMGKHTLVIDTGTCITYDVIEKSGVHLGGMISPGLNMRYKSMHEMTAHLPLVEDDGIFSHLASDTDGALRLGGKYGMFLEVEGYVRHMKQLYNEINVYLTGGDAQFLKEKLSEAVIIEKDLISHGLYEILKWNEEKI